jgi:hypothetical protein
MDPEFAADMEEIIRATPRPGTKGLGLILDSDVLIVGERRGERSVK